MHLKGTELPHTVTIFFAMSNRIGVSLLTLPVELVYRILDYQNEYTILCSMRNVCQRLDIIVNGYYQCRVKFCEIFLAAF